MERAAIEERVKEVIEEQFGEEVDFSADIQKEYDLDSIDLMDFIMTLEEEFDIRFSDEDMEEMKSVDDIIDRIEELA